MSVPITGQLVISGTAQVLTTPVSVNAFTLKAPATNNQRVYIGKANVTTANGYPLDPGETFEYERHDQSGSPLYSLTISDFYAVGTAGDIIAWFGSP